MTKGLDIKRIVVYLAFAFGIAWATALVIYRTGGLQNSPLLAPNITLALVLLAVVYMSAPTMAHILTRLITREGWQNVYLRPKLRRGWKYWLICWFAPGILTIVGLMVFFALFPRYYDPSLSTLRQMLEQAGKSLPPINPWTIIMLQLLQAMLIAPFINGIFTFGEEFGWRAYLQPKLMPLGGRKAMILMGIIWGVWHWPVIAMGHNYGLDYPGFPWLGLLAMVWFTFLIGTVIGWATLRGGSVWPAVIGHAAINGIAGIGVLMAKGNPNPILGPMPVGIIGSIGFAIVVLWIFLRPDALEMPKAELPQVQEDAR
ncbi:MAG: CPBP family intramembrane metalloprotease [Anaerolineales bacterium]|nr:CPBP family intramembrane metalloprotease [Anaerolineales bacterium]